MKKLKRGEKKEIYTWLKLKQSNFSNIISGRQRVGRARAAELEKISGISRIDWLYLDTEKLTELIIQKWENK